MSRRTRVLPTGAVFLVALLLLVLGPISWQLNRITVRLYVIWTDDLGLGGGVLPEDFGYLLNVLLFVPVGALVAVLTRWPWWAATLVVVAASGAIELVQVVPTLHRQASVADVVTNGLGGLLGVLLVAAVRRRRARMPDKAGPTGP